MIPKTIFHIWISDKPCPEYFKKYTDSWSKFMPDYEIKYITKDNCPRNMVIERLLDLKMYSVANHFIRYILLYQHGGIYMDLDIEVVKSFDTLLSKAIVIGWEDAWVVNNAVMMSEKGHPYMKALIDAMLTFNYNTPQIELETGPRLTTKLRHLLPEIQPTKAFYPYHYTEEYYPECVTDETYAIHHWRHSWNDGVSIVIPCYNQAHWLGDAIKSCMEQKVKPIEIIVVNDGSPDNTSEVARQYPVKLIEKENGGLSSARNAGIKEAKGKYIITLDADDKIHPDFIKKTVGLDDIVSIGVQEFGDSMSAWLPPQKNPKHEDFLKNNRIICASLFKREIWEKIGGYDEKMKLGYEDWDFWCRATKAGYTVTCIDDILFFYRRHGKSMVDGARANHQAIRDYMATKY